MDTLSQEEAKATKALVESIFMKCSEDLKKFNVDHVFVAGILDNEHNASAELMAVCTKSDYNVERCLYHSLSACYKAFNGITGDKMRTAEVMSEMLIDIIKENE